MRRATCGTPVKRKTINISIHALHEESDDHYPYERVDLVISIHALHEESDENRVRSVMRRRSISIHALHEESDRNLHRHDGVGDGISIHALHEESDPLPSIAKHVRPNFNPRSP